MLQALVNTATQFLTDVNQSLFRTRGSVSETALSAQISLPKYRPLPLFDAVDQKESEA